MHLLKSGLNIRKYFRIISNLLYIFEVTESIGFNVQKIVLTLILKWYLPKTERYTFFIFLFSTKIVSMMTQQTTCVKYPPTQNSDQSTYDNIGSFMNFTIDMHNFSIYNAKEYIHRSFPEIFGQTYDHRHLSRFGSKEQNMSAHRNLYRMFSIVTILISSVYISL